MSSKNSHQITCKKLYINIPFAHRQHRHKGNCSFIHGHNWDIGITFGCSQLDENGFVIDFGSLDYINEWIEKNLDHACLFNNDDPHAQQIINAIPGIFKPYLLKDCSCEGLAQHLWEKFNQLVQKHSNNRVSVLCIEIYENAKNSATFFSCRENHSHL
jgi:6-pyruvoyltetrahydropterin/6-carboxytetrahydropterin synthase